ncbi:hypothetical protein VTO42DRAFT_7832 [Malbranchea cinnamomea]
MKGYAFESHNNSSKPLRHNFSSLYLRPPLVNASCHPTICLLLTTSSTMILVVWGNLDLKREVRRRLFLRHPQPPAVKSILQLIPRGQKSRSNRPLLLALSDFPFELSRPVQHLPSIYIQSKNSISIRRVVLNAVSRVKTARSEKRMTVFHKQQRSIVVSEIFTPARIRLGLVGIRETRFDGIVLGPGHFYFSVGKFAPLCVHPGFVGPAVSHLWESASVPETRTRQREAFAENINN